MIHYFVNQIKSSTEEDPYLTYMIKKIIYSSSAKIDLDLELHAFKLSEYNSSNFNSLKFEYLYNSMLPVFNRKENE